MRERLALAFGALAVLAVLLAGSLRLVALQDLLREEEHAHLEEHARVMEAVLDEQAALREPVTPRVVDRVLDQHTRLELQPAGGGDRVVVTGAEYAGDGVDDVSVDVETRAGAASLSSRAPTPIDYYAEDAWSLLMLAALVALLAGLVGWWLAVRLSQPFIRLAGAAAALGRGRFDLDLPDTRVPEARAIGRALHVSAAQLEARVAREREFAEHASHVLRTPLTGLRLELEDLTLRDDLPEDVRESAQRCLDRVDAVNASAGDLVALSRSSAWVEGAETTLEDLARHATQEWSDQLAGRRAVSAAVEGDLGMRLTPGPMEQVLDLLLTDVRHGVGPVRLVFVGDDGHVRVRLSPGSVPHGSRRDGLDAASALAGSQGGRITDAEEGEVEVLLPRR